MTFSSLRSSRSCSPTCVCGSTIDPKGQHVFNYRHISKSGCHNHIRDGFKHTIKCLLRTAQVIMPSSGRHIEPANIMPEVPDCWPFDLSFRPDNMLTSHDVAPCPFSEIGFDVTITASKGYRPPSCHNASPSQPATAIVKHLCEKEKSKLKRQGMAAADSTYFSGEDLIGSLLTSNKVLIRLAISPHGLWGSMFHALLFGAHPKAFFGHSYTAPTLKEYALQQLGLVISNALAIHLRDAKRGALQASASNRPPSTPPDFPIRPTHPTPPLPCSTTSVNSSVACSPHSLFDPQLNSTTQAQLPVDHCNCSIDSNL
ncbi:hypothetical protein ACHAXN_013211 [Cyclotella atomus]